MDSHQNRAETPAGLRSRRQTEENFSQLVAGVRDYAVFLLDAGGHVLTWNEGAEEIKGYLAEEIIGSHFSRFYPPEAISSGWPEHELKVASETGRFEDEGWRLRKDGTRFWANVVIAPLREDNGSTRGFLKITRDLTDRKQAEEELRLSEERFRLMVEGVKDYAIFMLNPDGTVATWNRGAEELKGYQAAEIIGKHFSIFYPQEALARDWPAEELRIAEQQGRLEDEGWRLRKDGTTFWANVVITALRDEQGRLQGFAKVTRDLSERVKNEERARALAREEAARRAAEDAAGELDRQREELRVTLASIGDGVIVTDADGAITFINSVAEQLTGWKLAQAAGLPLEQVFHIVSEETGQPVENPATKALREKAIVALANHTALIARDGTAVPIEDSAAPIYMASGQISGVVLVFRDVTEARRSLETRLYLASIVESSDDAIIGKSLNGQIASWNKGAERLYGYSSAEAVGKPLAIIVPPDHLTELDDIMARVRNGERLEHYETVRLRKDGTRVLVSLTVSPVLDREGQIIGISKIGRDITSQRQAQEQQARHAERFRLLWESAAALLSNDATEGMLQEIFARIAPHLSLDAFLNFLLDEDQESLRLASHAGFAEQRIATLRKSEPAAGLAALVASTGRVAVQPNLQDSCDPALAGLRESGASFCVCYPLAVENRFLGTLTFLSWQRTHLAPDELEFLQTLSQYVGATYERERLLRQLREADRRKDHFLATLAHELRNPLAPLRNGLQVIKLADIPNETVRKSQAIMDRQLTHMVRLIDDLLDIARISQGKITLQKQRVRLADVVSSALETSRPLIERHGHDLSVTLPPETLWMDVDVTRIAQVISNLVNNAAKYTPHGGRIVVSATRREDQVHLRVTDNGVGIPPTMLHRVFEAFSQVDRALERSEGGLGIGLSLVKGLVELHGGDVEVRSEGDHRGSEFTVRLPLAVPFSERSSTALTVGGGVENSGLRILVVDDNRDSVMTMTMILEMMRHQTREAYDGAQAVQEAAEYRPHLILMDIGMPLLDGYEACRQIRAQEWGRDITIVALSGWGQEDDKRKAQEAGFDSHLTKPVDPAALSQLVTGLQQL